MARRNNPISGWSFPVEPETVVERTKKGGYTADLKTGEEPKTGSMVSIPGNEVPVPMDKFSEQNVREFVTPQRREILSQPDMHLGTWRSSDDPKLGDAAYLDISRRFPDTGAGAQGARKAAMEGSQWALYNIDRNKFESNITKPEVVEGIKSSKKVEIPENEIQEYAQSTNPIGEHMALGWRTEPDVVRTRSGRKKTVAGTGQMTFVELGSKAD